MNTPDFAFSYAPGKIILTGEHAVVYGSGAIAVALDRGVRVGIKNSDNFQHQALGPVLNSVGLGICGGVRPDPNGSGPIVLRKALAELIEIFGSEVKKLEISVDSAIPAGRGLGSSASISVAIIKGVSQFFKLDIRKQELIQKAMRLEKIFHGQPSGIDHTTICEGGVNFFQTAKDLNKNSYRLEKINCPRALNFAIGMAGPHLGTSKSVKALGERIKNHKAVYQKIFDGISEIANEMHVALKEGHLASVGELMNLNQGYLNSLGVSTPELEALCAIARKEGALGAKLTGAGGGGAVIALADGDAEAIAESFRAAGYLSFCTVSD